MRSAPSSCAAKKEDEPASEVAAAAGDIGSAPGMDKTAEEETTDITIEEAAPPLGEKFSNESSKVPEPAAGDTK